MNKIKDAVEQARKALLAEPKIEKVLEAKDFLSMGVTLLNLSCTNHIDRGLIKGHTYRLNGRTSGGKTFLGRTILAEAARNAAFDNYELIYDDIEHGALMDTKKFFGQRLLNRLVPPAMSKKGNPIHSHFTSDFYRRINKKLEAGKKVIWIADSLDALSPDEGKNGLWKQTKMSDNKAKAHSQELRRLMGPIAESGSILILVCQARVNMGSMFDDDITAGGRALEHYPSLEIWLRKTKTLKVTYKGMDYPNGSIIRAHIRKNRISGQDKMVWIPFYPAYGLDDLGACVDYLIAVKHWKGTKDGEEEYDDTGDKKPKSIVAKEFEFTGQKGDLIAQIETNKQQRELQILTGKVWTEIAKATSVVRTPRYT